MKIVSKEQMKKNAKVVFGVVAGSLYFATMIGSAIKEQYYIAKPMLVIFAIALIVCAILFGNDD